MSGISSGGSETPAITRAHWRPVDPALALYATAYDELRARWKAKTPLRGWKIGAHHAGGRSLLGVQTSLLGFLPTDTQYPDGMPIDLGGSQRPGIEAEIAVHMRDAITPAADEGALEAAIDGLTIAAEIVDIRGPHTDPSNVLRRNMFHRGYVLPARYVPRPICEYASVLVRIDHNGREQATASPMTVLGDIRWVVSFVAASLARMGEKLAAGHVILTGAVTPLPIWTKPGDTMAIDAGPLGRLEVKIAPVPGA